MKVSKKILICQQCGNTFTIESYKFNKFCSYKCRIEAKITLKDIPCLNCGEIFHQYSDSSKFCSQKCYNEYRTGKSINLAERTRTCEYCGNEFEVRSAGKSQKYCSRECMGKAQEGENHWMWKGDECLFICENCGTEYRDDSIRRQNNYNFCSNKCRHIYMRGENSPMWRGGLTFIGYPQEFNEKLKEQIRERDSRICQICLITEQENGNKLQVHHIDWNKLNCDPLNLISLCMICHGKVHTKENLTRDHLSKIAYVNTGVQCQKLK